MVDNVLYSDFYIEEQFIFKLGQVLWRGLIANYIYPECWEGGIVGLYVIRTIHLILFRT